MATRTNKLKVQDKYLDLVREVPLRPIRDEANLDQAIAMIDRLIDREALSQEEQDYLDVLTEIVHRYEAEEHRVEPLSDAEMLRHLIEAKEVNQLETAQATSIAESTISQVLNGKRSLSRAHIGKLSRYFNVEPGVFRFDE